MGTAGSGWLTDRFEPRLLPAVDYALAWGEPQSGHPGSAGDDAG